MPVLWFLEIKLSRNPHYFFEILVLFIMDVASVALTVEKFAVFKKFGGGYAT